MTRPNGFQDRVWFWPAMSGLVSLLSMSLTAVALLVPLKWALVPIVGLLVFFGFLLRHPIGRYLRMASYVVGVWGAVILSSSYDFGLRYGSSASAWARIGKTEWYVHLCLAGFASLLVILDFRSRVLDLGTASTLTKNRLTKYRYQLSFFSVALGLVSLVAIAMIAGDVLKSVSPSAASSKAEKRAQQNQLLDAAWDALAGRPDSRLITDFSQPNLERARRFLRDARTLGPHEPGVCSVEAAMHYATGEPELAEAALREGIRRAPDDFDLHLNLGVMLRIQRKWGAAADAFLEASRLEPRSPFPYFGLANSYKAQGLPREAAEHFEKVIALNPSDAQAHYEIALLLLARNDRERGISELAQAVRHAPENTVFRGQLARTLLADGQLERARGHYQRIVDRARGGANTEIPRAVLLDAYVDLGAILGRSGKLNEAESFLREATLLDPTCGEALANLGNVFYAQERFLEAIEAHVAAIAVEATAGRHLNLGNSLMATGSVDEAVVEFRAAIRLRPDFWKAHQKLEAAEATILSRKAKGLRSEGKTHEAIEAFTKSLSAGQRIAKSSPNFANRRMLALDFLNRGTLRIEAGQKDGGTADLLAAEKLYAELAKDPSGPSVMGELQRVRKALQHARGDGAEKKQ